MSPRTQQQRLADIASAIQQIRDQKGAKSSGGVVAVYHTKVKAQVRPIKVERRVDFVLKASLNKEVFQEGEEALIHVHSTQPIYLHLFSVTRDGEVTALLPNRFMTGNFLSANQELVFPSDALRSLGVNRFTDDGAVPPVPAPDYSALAREQIERAQVRVERYAYPRRPRRISQTISAAAPTDRMSPGAYRSPQIQRATRPASRPPPMPTRIVIPRLIGSGPGIARRPRAPTTSPATAIQNRNASIVVVIPQPRPYHSARWPTG